MERKELLLAVATWSLEPERYCIENQDRHVWNGKNFVERPQRIDPENPVALFATFAQASEMIHRILIKHYTGKHSTRQRYVLPIIVDVVSGNEPTSPEDILDFLCDAFNVEFNTDQFGNGPHGDLVLPQIDWNGFVQLRRKRKKDES